MGIQLLKEPVRMVEETGFSLGSMCGSDARPDKNLGTFKADITNIKPSMRRWRSELM